MENMLNISDWSNQLADLSNQVLENLPQDGDDWNSLRHFLQNTSRLLKNGDKMAGLKGLRVIIPYVYRGISSVDKYAGLNSSYHVTEAIAEHFLVDDAARQHLLKYMHVTKSKMAVVREKIVNFAETLDRLLDAAEQSGKGPGWFVMARLGFRANRIAALLTTCDYRLYHMRLKIDILDTHLARKSVLATLLYVISFVVGLAMSAVGNVPVGAVCLATAGASRKAVKSLSEYRRKLSEIDDCHQRLQADLVEWRARFKAETQNWLLLLGPVRISAMIAAVVSGFLLLTTRTNIVAFACLTLYILRMSERTNALRYYVGLTVAAVAAYLSYVERYERALAAFNAISSITLLYELICLTDV